MKKTPAEIIQDIQDAVEEANKKSPPSQIIIKMAGHGTTDGIMYYDMYSYIGSMAFTKEHFAILFDL